MNCKNCGFELPEGSSFCIKCGHDLRGIIDGNFIEDPELTKKIELCQKQKREHKLLKKFSMNINASKILLIKETKELHKLMQKFSENIHLKNVELYKKTEALHKSIKKFPKNVYSKKLVIIDGWTWVTEGEHTYVRGSVKNIGNIAMNYFEVNVKYKDVNKDVLDFDFTNWNRKIQPGESKEFEIKHHVNEKYRCIDISICCHRK